MLIGLNDFSVDIFMTFEDENIYIYLSDFETIPGLVNLVPLGSFDAETGAYLWINLDFEPRVEVGLLFLQRDLYARVNPDTKLVEINRDQFMTEFYNIPEVVSFFDTYKNICENYGVLNYEMPDSWIGWTKAAPKTQENPDGLDWWYEDLVTGKKYINWANYPQWCQTCSEFTYEDPTIQCAYWIPIEVMPPKDIYFTEIIYFNGIYRTNPESVQDFGVYQVLTDIDFEQNKYSLIIDIKRFFTLEFQWFLKTTPGNIPFACDYGINIKQAVQTKNTNVQRIRIENEINFFIHNFNVIYGDLVKVETIHVVSRGSMNGGDAWVIEVHAVIKKERLVYRIESE